MMDMRTKFTSESGLIHDSEDGLFTKNSGIFLPLFIVRVLDQLL